jgi:hypothetical protein
MFGLFNKKNPDGSEKLPEPKGIPDPAGQSLVVVFKEDPNWTWTLKAALKPKEEKDQFDIRVFSDRMAGAVKASVKDYSTLDRYPDLILYEGFYDKKNKKVKLERKYKKPD